MSKEQLWDLIPRSMERPTTEILLNKRNKSDYITKNLVSKP